MSRNSISTLIASISRNHAPPRAKSYSTRRKPAQSPSDPVKKNRQKNRQKNRPTLSSSRKNTADAFGVFATTIFVVATAFTRMRKPRKRTHSELRPPSPSHKHSLSERSKTTCRPTPCNAPRIRSLAAVSARHTRHRERLHARSPVESTFQPLVHAALRAEHPKDLAEQGSHSMSTRDV